MRRSTSGLWRLALGAAALAVIAVTSGAGTIIASDQGPEAWGSEARLAPPQETTAEEASDPEANLPYLFAVFIIVWAGFFAYAFVISRRQRDVRRELEALRMTLGETGRLSDRNPQESPPEKLGAA